MFKSSVYSYFKSNGYILCVHSVIRAISGCVMRYIILAVVSGIFLVGCNFDQESPPGDKKPESVRGQKNMSDVGLPQKATDFERENSSVGQLVYVPVYSHIYQQNRQKTFNLTTTLSIRNADVYRPFTITEVAYYDSKGNLIQQYVDSVEVIPPMASTSYVIEEADLRGGVGANFLVRWHSKEVIYPPVIEAVNITTSQQQGISFLSVGRVLWERANDVPQNQ